MIAAAWHENTERRVTYALKSLCIEDTWHSGDMCVRRNSHTSFTLSAPGVYERFTVRGDYTKLVNRLIALRDVPRTRQLALFRGVA